MCALKTKLMDQVSVVLSVCSWLSGTVTLLTFVFLLLLSDFPQLLCQLVDKLFLLELLARQDRVEISLAKRHTNQQKL